jgi:Zn-finger nucleic acid-binding protein
MPAPPAEAARIACPGCGAPSAREARRCGYCGIDLATARCPRCFALLFRGTKHCAECGADAAAPAHVASEQGESQRQCPRCSTKQPTALVAQLVGKTLLDQCGACGGLWLDRTAFEQLVEVARHDQGALSGLGGLQRPRRGLERAEQVRYVRCPDCDVVMNRQNYGKRSGVVVDVCRDHGIWFDDQELSRVLDFVRGGGLERTRKLEAEELREERRRLESLKTLGGAGGSGRGWLDLDPQSPRGDSGLIDVARVLSRFF